MYTREQLEIFPFFGSRMQHINVEAMLDPLTGIVSRRYILDFAKSLIEEKTPFSFAMLDLDNFKFINDTYGHGVGDQVLIDVAEKLARQLGSRGVAGRFGGDELMIVDLADRTYEEKKAFFAEIYSATVLRRNISLETCNPFITGTVGCATYPDDADDFDSLFTLIDKTLYRGKTKGRNCHIIYVESKHKDIEIRKLARHGVYTSMQSLVRQFEMVPTISNKLQSILPFLMDDLRISDLYLVDKSGRMRAIRDQTFDEYVPDIHLLLSDDLYSTNRPEDIAFKCPEFYAAMKRHDIETMVVVRIGVDTDTDGYLVCAEARNQRIWQEDECAILYFLAKMLAARIRIDHEVLAI
ncbi:MAG: GGDEF domain-containing protein [Clostridia bacterium]|nr:GGDEF domain-containing protein [Clostridia bacterium]